MINRHEHGATWRESADVLKLDAAVTANLRELGYGE
jgi:hypothetical protein